MSNQTSSFTALIREICREEGISLEAFSCDFAFRLEKGGMMNYIFGYQFGLNSAVSHMICEDKSTTSEILSYAGIPNIEHRCFMSPMNMKYVEADGNWNNILAMLGKYKTLVLKDNKGTGGLSVYRVRNAVELENAAQILFQSAHSISVSPYYNILQEYRLIYLDGEIKLVYHKERQHLTGDGIHTIRELYADYLKIEQGEILPVPAEDSEKILKQGESYPLNWKHNLGQGAIPIFDTDNTLTAPLKKLAKAAASCIGVRFASIDIVKIMDNEKEEYRILEINSGVMMEYLSQTDKIFRQTAKEIYREAIRKMLSIK
jgi:glutathione synthase/RimK-type ligase-like ATP-grasp enzyme